MGAKLGRPEGDLKSRRILGSIAINWRICDYLSWLGHSTALAGLAEKFFDHLPNGTRPAALETH